MQEVMYEKPKKIWDVVVIGGGPSGLIAAGRAAERGASVFLIEKNPILGKKLLITGGGRCNVTNAEEDVRVLLSKFNTKDKKADQFLFSPFSKFGVKETLEFFHTRGMETKEEALKRVFPASNTAQSVLDVLAEYIEKNKVTVSKGIEVRKIIHDGKKIEAVELANEQKVYGRSFIIATGGKSHPETGSTGDAFNWLKDLGHTVNDSNVALVPLSLSDNWAKNLSGVSLTGIKLTSYQNDAKQDTTTGKMLFTHAGISGPAVLNMSRDIGELLKYGKVLLLLDLLPKLAPDTLHLDLQERMRIDSNKKIKNIIGELIPSALVPIIFTLTKVDGDLPAHSILREQRILLAQMIKNIPLRVKGLLGVDKAVVTSGGIALEEIDWKTMRSTRLENVFVTGDVLDINRPTGGYSLQLCWTTGYIAGESAAKN